MDGEGGRLRTDIHMRKKGRDKQRAGIMVSIYRACRESRKQMRAKKEREDEDVRGEGNEGFSIHPGPGELVHRDHRPPEAQSLPEKQEEKKMLFRFSALFYFFVNHKNQRRHPNRYRLQCPLHREPSRLASVTHCNLSFGICFIGLI